MEILLWIGFGLVAGSFAKLAMPGPGAEGGGGDPAGHRRRCSSAA